MPGIVHLVCDYSAGDLAWSEIIAALADEMPDVRAVPTPVPSFDTIATGFVVAQLAGRASSNEILFANCAPRKDTKSARKDNEGEGLVCARLKNGVRLLVVNSGYSLSFVRDQIEELHATKASSKGSQFRSRDNFPSVLAQCLKGDMSFLDHKLELQAVPERPDAVVAYVDSFGNIKTSIRTGDTVLAELKQGQRITVTINGHVRHPKVTDGSFNVSEGDMAFAPGSSGYDGRNYWELFKRGKSAHYEFGFCPSGSKIEIAPFE